MRPVGPSAVRRKWPGLPRAPPLGELAGASPTERASRLSESRCTAISRLFVRAILSQCKSCLSASLPSPSRLRRATSPKGRGFGRPEGAKTPFSERQLREGVFFCFGEHHEYSYLLCFYYMPFPAKVKRCTESLQAPSPSAAQTPLPEGEPLACRSSSHWTSEARYGAKGRALLQRAGPSSYNLSVSLRSTAPLVGEPLAKPFTLRGLPKPPLGRGGGQIIISSATLAKKKDNITDIV